jgi:hypothetical protein
MTSKDCVFNNIVSVFNKESKGVAGRVNCPEMQNQKSPVSINGSVSESY